MAFKLVLILGDREPGFESHEALQDAVAHASADLGAVVNTRWVGADDLALRPGVVSEAHAVVLAPRSPKAHRTFPAPMIPALKLVRERGVPFLATGDAHDLVLIEIARNVLGMSGACSTYYDEECKDPVVKELAGAGRRGLTQRRPRMLDLEVFDDPTVRPWLQPGRREEPARVAHGINPDYAYAIEEAGLRTAGVDALTRRPHLYTLEGKPYHVTAAFLPQLASRARAPHPLFQGLLAHMIGAVPS